MSTLTTIAVAWLVLSVPASLFLGWLLRTGGIR